MTRKRVLYGAVAAAAAAFVALDATLFRPAEYPLAHKLFNGDWIIFRNLIFTFGSIAAAFFGYLALNVKNNGNTNSSAKA